MAGRSNIFYLGIKEMRSLWRDKMMLIFVLYAFTGLIYLVADATDTDLKNAPIAIVDEDQSQLSKRLINSFYGPYFKTPDIITFNEIDPVLDNGSYTFAITIPSGFQSDVLSGKYSLDEFKGLVACGGFSYGDVLGAGEGWAKSILFNNQARDQFAAFFERPDSFSLGVCNGCQMLSNLKSLIPGADLWPHFVTNQSERFEARVAMLEVKESKSIFFDGMQGSRMPIAVSHGEGRAEFNSQDGALTALENAAVSLQYVNNYGKVTQNYPANPNGSPLGIAGLTSADGRSTIMMPHPERVFRSVANSWYPNEWQEDGAWMRMFRNARVYLG